MLKRFVSYVILFFFFVTITVPIVFSNKRGGTISVMENRYLASFPDLFKGNLSTAEKRSGFDAWLKDNVKGRGFATKMMGTISFCLFGVVPEPEIVVGNQDWLYWMPTYDIPNFTNTNLPSSDRIASLRERLANLTSDIKADGADLTIMLWPTKANVYPEHFPSSLEKVNLISSLESLDLALRSNAGFDFTTAFDELVSSKDRYQVYYKAFDKYHWNQRGSFVGYLALMEQARGHLPDLKIYTENDYLITHVSRETKTEWGLIETEEDEEFILRKPHPSVSDKTYFTRINFASEDIWQSYNYFFNTDISLPKAILIGDSYLWMYRLEDIADSFSELVFINYLDLHSLPGLVETLNPDLIMMALQGAGMAEFVASYEYRLVTE